MSPPAPCPNCGAQPDVQGERCPTCGASTLRNVVVRAVDPKTAFQAARALSALGAPAPSFAECRDRLVRGGAVLVQVSASFADAAIAALGGAGVAATAPLHVPVRRAVWPVAAAAGLTVVLACGAWFATRRPRRPVAPAAAIAVAVPSATPPIAAPVPLTLQQLSKRVTDRIAGIRCGQQLGSGFFVGKDRLVSNAHVVCKKGPLSIVLPDGRTLLGQVVKRDDWTDTAEVDVFGADMEPLTVGDSTALEVGDPIVFVGSPRGLDFTVHEGKVSFVGRNLLGLAYVQINAAVNPGNSGGPMFNAQGEVLGIVSMKAADADGIGFVLPLEYVQEPADPAALIRWRGILAHVAEEDRRAVRAELDALPVGKPQLLGIKQDGFVSVAMVIERWDGAPSAGRRNFTLTTKDGTCAVRASFQKWLSLADATSELESRQLSWLIRNNLDRGRFVSAGALESAGCSRAQLAGDARIAIQGREADLFDLDARKIVAENSLNLPTPSPPPPRPNPELARAAAATEEASWRARFRNARDRIAQVERNAKLAEQRIREADAAVAGGNSQLTPEGRIQYFRLKDQVARKDAESIAAAEALHDLERQAANAGIPFEWRR